MAPKVKSILMAVAFLMPAFLVGFLFIFLLIQIDYGPDPGRSVAMSMASAWLLISGFYFKSIMMKTGGFLLLGLMVINLWSAAN